jgi:hypothetical protein
MSEKIICERADLVAIADAIRTASGTTDQMKLEQMAIAASSGVAAKPLETFNQ